jgi:hypothetical protein
MLGRQNPQMDLADAVLWTGKVEPKPLVEKATSPRHGWSHDDPVDSSRVF